MTNNFTPAKTGNQRPRLSKEEYAEKMKAEKEAVYQMSDDAAKAIVSDPEKFKAFLDTQSRLDRYSAVNALLIFKQLPEASQLKNFDDWSKDNIKITKGAKSISILEPVEYAKRDEEGNIIGKSRAIDEVSLDIEPGQFIAILGHNGSGKSTLAKHMNALLVPSDGTMWVDGMDTKEDEHLWDVRQSAGMVFQNPDNQIIGTVVEEDVGFGPENLGVPTEEIWQRVEDSLKAVGMIEYRHHSPNKLSGGQKQRVAIAGVMAMRPKCIVLDEPTAMLDPNGRKEVLRSVMELRKREHITVILITHYMEEVVDADHVFVMDHGHVVMQGTPREIFSQVDTLKHYRLDVPQVTILADELRKRGLDIPAGVLKKEELVEILCRLN